MTNLKFHLDKVSRVKTPTFDRDVFDIEFDIPFECTLDSKSLAGHISYMYSIIDGKVAGAMHGAETTLFLNGHPVGVPGFLPMPAEDRITAKSIVREINTAHGQESFEKLVRDVLQRQ